MEKRCDCPEPDIHVMIVANCKVSYADERLVVDIANVEYRSILTCVLCDGRPVIELLDCPFLVMRDIVAQVCTSCVKQDGRVRFATQHNFCNRPPIIQGPAFEKMD